MDLWEQINELNNLLTKAISELKERGKQYAKAYSNYRVMLSKELLELRAMVCQLH